ncbi:MAG: VWA domain-containing protein [Acidobacteria bacterium]|nr:VWA domain-containing protein [Acidobacteriota bacterium]
MNRARIRWLLIWTVLLGARPLADAGVLIPSSVKSQPDPAILSLEEMQIRIEVDQGLMRVRMIQYYASHDHRILEGTYLFSFPPGASLSDFAIWDGVTRIPGVILEKRKAAEIYRDLAAQAIDPGLLQMGGEGEESEIPADFFTVKVAPIPPRGFKRVELEYQQHLAVHDGRVEMVLPLKSRIFPAQTVRSLSVELAVADGRAIRDFALAAAAYPLPWRQPDANRVVGAWQGRNVVLTEDFGFKWSVDTAQPSSVWLTWRGRESELLAGRALTAEDRPASEATDDGYFLLDHLFPASPASGRRPVTAIVALDTSLSMWWGKLQQAHEALRAYLGALQPTDDFNLVLFGEKARPVFPKPVAATPENVGRALEVFLSGYLAGGTDPVPALEVATAQAAQGRSLDRHLVLIGDWMPTTGHVKNAAVLVKVKPLLQGRGVKVHGVATGDDANRTLLEILAGWTGGQVLALGSREDITTDLRLQVGRFGREPFGGLGLEGGAGVLNRVYPAHPVSIFAAASGTWVGRYKPAPDVTLRLRGAAPDGAAYEQTVTAVLPERNLEHDLLPRVWARARVDFLLDRINREGEDAAGIREIIELSRKYKFVTPYTSFLAAPRSLLRPRVIQPKDPVLRVAADPSVVAATVRLPWGETLPMRWIESLGVWQTRFFVPAEVADGTHRCLVILRDGGGRLYREEKSFVIDSRAPAVRWRNMVETVAGGARLRLDVDAPPDTRHLTATIEGGGRVRLAWSAADRCCTGMLSVPAGSAPGMRVLSLVAEDQAHNVYRKDYQVRILP